MTAAAVDNEANTATATACATVSFSGWCGFTPGYWKNHPKSWSITAYEPCDKVTRIFEVPNALTITRKGVRILDFNDNGCNDTLMNALGYKGGSKLAGKAGILLRAAVAALLNESALGPDYPAYESTADLVADVNATLATRDLSKYTILANSLDYWNNGIHVFPE